MSQLKKYDYSSIFTSRQRGICDSGFALSYYLILPIWKQCYFLCKSTHSKFCTNKSCKFQTYDCRSNRNKSPHPWGWCKEPKKVPNFSFFLVAHKVIFMEGHIPIRPDRSLLLCRHTSKWDVSSMKITTICIKFQSTIRSGRHVTCL